LLKQITSLSIIFILCLSGYTYGQSSILIDQLGYRPGDPKLAFTKDVKGGVFTVTNLAANQTAYEGKISPLGTTDESTSDTVYTLDFTNVTKPGRYQITMPGTDVSSNVFRVDDSVYNSCFSTSMGSYYYQRCAATINNGTQWQHPACHLNDAVFFDNPSAHRDVVGGWHDAGDYGKFIPTSSVTLGFLLTLYELQPDKFTDNQANIPECNDAIPDILDEARFELKWMLKMQREDGGVFHKVSTKKWTGEHLPQKDHDIRYIFGVSSCATASFAAVTAQGARIFERWDKPFATSLLGASMEAWKFLMEHPDNLPEGGFKNPPGVEGGEYGDTQDADERLWASSELLRTTGFAKYGQYFLANYRKLEGINSPVSWTSVKNFAYYSYLRLPSTKVDPQIKIFIMTTLGTFADNLLRRIEQNGYRYILDTDEYYWGSNSIAAGYTFDLIQIFELTKQRRYLNAALDQMHYLLGRNTFDLSFVTGVGTNPVQHPYHQLSMMLKMPQPVPGFLVGGANKNSNLHGKKISDIPGKCYEDNEKNYFVNEVAINYTAPLVFLSGYLSNFPSWEGHKSDSIEKMTK
jgi:endoglucanase